MPQSQRGIKNTGMKTLDASTLTEQQRLDDSSLPTELVLQQVMSGWADKLIEDGNPQEADKLLELCEKEREGQLVIAMCGHFSAGKSTVINQMCGKRLLPSSPIPTSANVVSIRYGARRAEIVYRDREQDQPVQVPLEQLEQVCRDGERIEKVYIYDEVEWLKEGAVLLDTPGVDSVDDLHLQATESALHMADVVCYVTDYNHVLSEINFTFAKQVADAGKPLIWIVNQIDKHRESELNFEQYREDVRKSLHDWLIKPAAIFYVSMLEPDHAANEWPLVMLALQLIVSERKVIVQFGIEQAARHILNQHLEKKRELVHAEHEVWMEQQGGESVIQNARSMLRKATEAYQLEAERLEQIQRVYQDKLEKMLRDANITPAQLRDLAQQYIESCQTGFRVGIWNRKEKTEQERTQRLQQFAQRWQEEMQANISVHVTAWARELANELNEPAEDLSNEVERCVSGLNHEWLAQYVQTGTIGSNEYTMNYCRLISEEAKSQIRKQMLQAIEPLMIRIKQDSEQKLSIIQQEIQSWQYKLQEDDRFRDHMKQIHEESTQLLNQMGQLDLSCDQSVSASHYLPDLSHAALLRLSNRGSNTSRGAAHHQHVQLMEITDIDVRAVNKGKVLHHYEMNAQEHPDSDISQRWQHAALMLTQTADLLEQSDLLTHMAVPLRAKAQRLRDHEFSVALFGAFSAGKSSFANALMGQALLPVSPNPTTAAINRIVAPTGTYKDHTALIKLKTEEMLLADLRYALECMGAEEAVKWNISQIMQAADRWQPDMLLPSGKAHYSFIQAVKRGYDDIKSLLGQEMHVSYEEYREYVSIEAKSAFVTSVDLFAHNPWTNQGFTFVDTPGADSINARHTGVSFEYIKNADMILFVTYYNHAFSQADRQFLTQLGRVKDSFELDKMFFIVNAADLAANQTELESVLEYMRMKLQEFGIRSPRLFAVSSLKALEWKLSEETDRLPRSGFTQFEGAFQHFAAHELSDMAIQAAAQDIEHVMTHIQSLVSAAKVDAMDRESQLQELRARVSRAVQQLAELRNWSDSKRIEQELEELLYHIRQRMHYQFSDSFALAFNPATLRADEKYIERALNQCYGDWQRSFERELTNELLATSLRMEQLCKRLIQEKLQRTMKRVCEEVDGYQYSPPSQWSAWETPEVEIKHIDGEFSSRKLKSMYRSSKAFFEGGGRETLKGHLEHQALDRLNWNIQSIKSLFIQHLEQHVAATMQGLVDELTASLSQYERSMEQVWSQDGSGERYEQVAEQLKMYRFEMR